MNTPAYFDFNPPVITDPSVLVAEFSTGYRQAQGQQLRVWPSPANDLLTLHADKEIATITLHAVDGRMLRSIAVRAADVRIDVSDLPSGQYLLVSTFADGATVSSKTSILHH